MGKNYLHPRTFTRKEILDAITLHPCHVTGMHDPRHTPKYVCDIQMREAFEALLEFLEVEITDLPRRLHDSCGWCRDDTESGKEIRAWRKKGLISS